MFSTFEFECSLSSCLPKSSLSLHDALMEKYQKIQSYDLITPDGMITKLTPIDDKTVEAIVFINKISPHFVGFEIPLERVFFNVKSTVAQLGLDGVGIEYHLDKNRLCAEVKVLLKAIGAIAIDLLRHINVGVFIGKLFAADDRRLVQDPPYLTRMFGRSDRWGSPLLSLGGFQGSDDLILEKIDGRTVAYLTLQNGRVVYDPGIFGFLPAIAKMLATDIHTRELIGIYQQWSNVASHSIKEDEILLVKTLPLHIRTVFARVVPELLSVGYHHTSASILQPETTEEGDIYELYGNSDQELIDIPLEFYTLEPYREYVFFADRDQLQKCLENNEMLFQSFTTAPLPLENPSAVFIVKSDQILNLKPTDWVSCEARYHEFPGISHSTRQALLVERYIEQQPSYPFLKGIEDGEITSQGVLLTRYFPSPLMKRMLLSNQVQRELKAIYFRYPSRSHGQFFSEEDHALLHDLYKFGIPVFWVDKEGSGDVLQFTQKSDRDAGMFVPLSKVTHFLQSTVFGIYGSNLKEGVFENELRDLFEGVLAMRNEMNHPLLYKDKPLSLITGGGPGAMEVGNRIAKSLGILSCANIVDFSSLNLSVNEQKQNLYIEAKMTFRLDKLVKRQAEFNLDFPIFLMGGIGTDFEFSLEEVGRKVGAVPAHPILLLGDPDYWHAKITSRFQCNLKNGTIQGSEWISNCFFCITKASQGIKVYRDYFNGSLAIGRNAPMQPDGFVPETRA